MRATHFLSATLVAMLALSGCSHGLSVSASSKQDQHAKLDLSRGVEKREAASVSNKVSAAMPEEPLAVQAIDAIDINKLGAEHQAAARAIDAAVGPVRGWPSDCLRLPGMPRCTQNDRYAQQAARNVIFSNSVLLAMSKAVSSRVHLADPSAARESLAKAFLNLSEADLASMRATAKRVVQSARLNRDETGTASVKFFLGDSTFEGTGQGWSWAKENVAWFGAGKLSGRDITVALDHSNDAGVTKTKNETTNVGTGVSSGNGGDASVK